MVSFLVLSCCLTRETERKITDLLMTGYMLKVTARYQVLANCTKGLTGTVQSPAVELLRFEFQGKRHQWNSPQDLSKDRQSHKNKSTNPCQ